MSSRISAGFTASTLALAAGGISVSLSLIVAAIIFFVLSFVFAILTFAHRLPLLHRLPEVGAPKIDVTLHQEVASPNGVVVQVGIRSPTRLDDSVFVFLAPDDVPVVPSDHQATPLPAGPPMLPTSERVVPYTNSHPCTLPLDLRRGSNLAWFALGPCPAGHRSRIRIKLDSEKLYRGFIVT